MRIGASFSWAYTNVREDYTVLGPVVCAGARGVGSADVPLWQQALGALVLTHEAFHLRHWRFRRNEGKVECQARQLQGRHTATRGDGRTSRGSTPTRWHCTITRSGSSPSTAIRSASSCPGIRRRLQDDQLATATAPQGEPDTGGGVYGRSRSGSAPALRRTKRSVVPHFLCARVLPPEPRGCSYQLTRLRPVRPGCPHLP